MGLSPELAHCALRISTGRSTTSAELERFSHVLGRAAADIRALSAGTNPSLVD
jgi:cysteine sulfinate desulfinase/cysteine desulfurase-like protein